MKKTSKVLAGIAFISFLYINSAEAQGPKSTSGTSTTSPSSSEEPGNNGFESHPGVIQYVDWENNSYLILDTATGETINYTTTNTLFNPYENVTILYQKTKSGKVIVRNVTR